MAGTGTPEVGAPIVGGFLAEHRHPYAHVRVTACLGCGRSIRVDGIVLLPGHDKPTIRRRGELVAVDRAAAGAAGHKCAADRLIAGAEALADERDRKIPS